MSLRLEGLTCPECGSSNVKIGNLPLECDDCGWNHLNQYPCRVCGGKSVSSASSGKVTLYGCKDHPVTYKELGESVLSFYHKLKPMPRLTDTLAT